MSGGGAERGRHRIWSRLQAPSCQHRARCLAQTHELWDILFIDLFTYLVIYWVRERERERERDHGGGEERGRDRTPRRCLTVRAEPNAGLDLTNREIMTWAKIKSWTLNRLSHPGAPVQWLFKNFFLLIYNAGEIKFHSIYPVLSISLVISTPTAKDKISPAALCSSLLFTAVTQWMQSFSICK